MNQNPEEVFADLLSKDKERAEGCITKDRVGIMSTNGLIPISQYTLDILFAHYRAAENLREIHRNAGDTLGRAGAPVMGEGGKLLDLVERIEAFGKLYAKQASDLTLNTTELIDLRLSTSIIERRLDEMKIPSKTPGGEIELSLAGRVSYALGVLENTRSLITKVTGTLSTIEETTKQRIKAIELHLAAVKIIGVDTPRDLAGALRDTLGLLVIEE